MVVKTIYIKSERSDNLNELLNMIECEIQKKPFTNCDVIHLFWNIGKQLSEQSLNMIQLERNLKQKYGVMIGFTQRNFLWMKKFYENNNNLNSIDIEISWLNHTKQMKQNHDKRTTSFKEQEENYILFELQQLQNNMLEKRKT